MQNYCEMPGVSADTARAAAAARQSQ